MVKEGYIYFSSSSSFDEKNLFLHFVTGYLTDDIHITNRSRFAIYVTVTINTPFYLLLSSNNRRLLNAQAKAVVVEEEEGESLNDMENYLNTCADIDEEILSESAFTGVDPMGAVMQRVNTINLKFENDEKLKLTVEFEPDSSKRTCYFKEGQLQIHFKSHSKRVGGFPKKTLIRNLMVLICVRRNRFLFAGKSTILTSSSSRAAASSSATFLRTSRPRRR